MSELVTKTYVWPMATDGMAAVISAPLMVPWTLTTSRPETKVTYEPAGISLAAVNITEAPAIGGLQVLDDADLVGAGADPVEDGDQPSQPRFSKRPGLQSGSSHVQVEASTERVGNGVNGNGGLLAGQETMNIAARV